MKTKFTLFFFTFAFCVNTNITYAQVNVQDSLALVDLYDSTDGPNWPPFPVKWKLHSPVSQWIGVFLSNNRVIGLSLSSFGLVGTIPSSIGNLSNLQFLVLDD